MKALNVLCFGNALHGDDGLGAAVAARLKDVSLPANVNVYNAGTLGLNALPLFEHCSHVLIVDVAELGLSIGDSRFILPDTLDNSSSADHMGGVSFLLQAVSAIVKPTPIINILAVQPSKTSTFSPSLSVEMTLSLERLVNQVSEFTVEWDVNNIELKGCST
ncbi:hydrogenase maturation protease [Enterovibrio makurazakiensis]|uniref:hydrogenase maturation protease n=1 Tax=Enterovibrio makurazakiensis TaxID=2910232 RepID=UPI003D24E5E8